MVARPWKDRQYDASRLVVAKPGRLDGGRRYNAGDRFRPDRSVMNMRRVRQLWDQRVLLTDEEWRRLSGQEPNDPAAEQEAVAESSNDESKKPQKTPVEDMTRHDLLRELRRRGASPGPNSKRETLIQQLRSLEESQ